MNYRICSGQGGGSGQGKVTPWVPSWVLSLPLPWLALGGMLLPAVGYAVSSVGICEARAGGGRVTGYPVYTTSKKRYVIMTIPVGCMPYHGTRWRWTSLVVKSCHAAS